MTAQHSIEFRQATDEEEKIAIACLKDHTAKSGGINTKDVPFAVFAVADEKIVGGVIGKVFWNWLYADLVWVEEDYRGRGIGRDVMVNAEKKAEEMGLTGIYLWTESWQGPEFYPKLGYQKFTEFEDFPPGHKRFGFRKYLQRK